jgi:tetratricopeptide (TPR) repeat protein
MYNDRDMEQMSDEMLAALDLAEKAHTLVTAGEYDEAARLLDQAETVEPMCSRIYLERGGMYVMQDELEKAIDQYKRCLLINKKDGEAHFMMGNTYLMMDDWGMAELSYKKADEYGYKDIYLLHNLGYAQERQGEYDDAVAVYERCIDTYPDWYPPRLRLAGCLMTMHRYDDAIKVSAECEVRFLDIPECCEQLAHVYLASGHLEDAERTIREGLERFPKYGPLLLALMENSVLMGRDEEADQIAQQIVSLPDVPDVFAQRAEMVQAQAYFKAQKLPEAITCFERVIEHEPEGEPNVEARSMLMTLYRHEERWEDLQRLAADCQRTKEADGLLCAAYAMEPLAATKLGHPTEAEVLYRNGLRHLIMICVKESTRIDAHAYRCMCHTGLGEFDKAREQLRYMKSIIGDNLATKELEADILRAEGNVVEADRIMAELQESVAQLSKEVFG